MGIKNLNNLLKQHCDYGISEIKVKDLKGTFIAIDTSIFLYKSLINVRYKGDYLKNKDGKIISHIQGLYYKTNTYLSLGITPIHALPNIGTK